VAASYSNIGNVYNSQGQYEQALEYHQKALEIFIKVSGQDHPRRGGVQEKHRSSLGSDGKEE